MHRMVQFLILISGMDRQQEILRQVATMTISEMVCRYRQCLNVLIWTRNHLFVHPFIVGIGCYIEAGMITANLVQNTWDNHRTYVLKNLPDDSLAFGKKIGYKYFRLGRWWCFATPTL